MLFCYLLPLLINYSKLFDVEIEITRLFNFTKLFSNSYNFFPIYYTKVCLWPSRASFNSFSGLVDALIFA